MIMIHSDDEGLVLPPKIAPNLAAIVPIYKKEEEKQAVVDFCKKILDQICGSARLQAGERLCAKREILSVFYDGNSNQSLVLDLSLIHI